MKSIVELRGFEFRMDDKLKPLIQKAAEWLIDPNGKRGLLLCGLYGNGKTTMAKALGLLISRLSELEFGFRERKIVRLLTTKEICRIFTTEPKEYENLFFEEFLIVDDLGHEPKEIMLYGMIHTPIIDLICERYDRQLMTIITTNYEADQIEKDYKSRVRDRLREMMDTIIFTNPSYRK